MIDPPTKDENDILETTRIEDQSAFKVTLMAASASLIAAFGFFIFTYTPAVDSTRYLHEICYCL